MALVALPAGDVTTQLGKALEGGLAGSAFIAGPRQENLRDQLATYYGTANGRDLNVDLRRYVSREAP